MSITLYKKLLKKLIFTGREQSGKIDCSFFVGVWTEKGTETKGFLVYIISYYVTTDSKTDCLSSDTGRAGFLTAAKNHRYLVEREAGPYPA